MKKVFAILTFLFSYFYSIAEVNLLLDYTKQVAAISIKDYPPIFLKTKEVKVTSSSFLSFGSYSVTISITSKLDWDGSNWSVPKLMTSTLDGIKVQKKGEKGFFLKSPVYTFDFNSKTAQFTSLILRCDNPDIQSGLAKPENLERILKELNNSINNLTASKI